MGTASLCVIVPFRDQPEQNRGEQLDIFARRLPQFLRQHARLPRLHVIVVEATQDGYKFNRGKLLNIGYALARADDADGRGTQFGARPTVLPIPTLVASTGGDGGKSMDSEAPSVAGTRLPKFTSFCLHDVDLLPQHPGLAAMYAQVPASPVHVASAWGEYSYPKYIGGALCLSSLIMERCNGYPNSFWGWGGEDDDMHSRLERTGFGLGHRVKAPPQLRGTVLDVEAELLRQRGGVRAGTSLKDGG